MTHFMCGKFELLRQQLLCVSDNAFDQWNQIYWLLALLKLSQSSRSKFFSAPLRLAGVVAHSK